MTSLDTQRDAIALIRASLENDREAADAILDQADLRAVAAELAWRADILATWAMNGPENALAFFAQVQHDWAADEAAQ